MSQPMLQILQHLKPCLAVPLSLQDWLYSPPVLPWRPGLLSLHKNNWAASGSVQHIQVKSCLPFRSLKTPELHIKPYTLSCTLDDDLPFLFPTGISVEQKARCASEYDLFRVLQHCHAFCGVSWGFDSHPLWSESVMGSLVQQIYRQSPRAWPAKGTASLSQFSFLRLE